MARTWTPSQESAMSIRDKTLLVSAAAGSGKTSVLTERIIRSLIDKDHPADLSRMLVVTFTRAAAAELKSRIATALTEAMAKDPGNSYLSRQLFLLGSAQISTIDSFFQKIVRENFEQLDIPATFRIADESEIQALAAEILTEVLEEFYRKYQPRESEDDMFSRVRKNPFANAMDHLMSNRSDGKLEKILLEFEESFAADPRGIEVLKDSAVTLAEGGEKDFFQTSYGALMHNYLTEQFSTFLPILEEFDKELQHYDEAYAKCSGLLSSDIDFCKKLLAVLPGGTYTDVRNVVLSFSNGRFPGKINEKPAAAFEYQEFRNILKNAALKAKSYLQFPEEAIARQCKESAELAKMLYLFYSAFEARLMKEKKNRGILEYNDVRALLYKLLTSPDGSPSPFAKSLAGAYDAVYIDEYQDVDAVQDRIFSLIGEDRRFMVGDIKQSIYGFRGSEPSIFAGYRRRMPLYTDPKAEGADGVCVFMSDNFRCDRPVIEFTNLVCSFLFSACKESVGYQPEDDLICGKGDPQPPLPSHPAQVQICVFDAPPRKNSDTEDEETSEKSIKEEAIWTAKEIARLIKNETLDNGAPIRPSDIAILVRNKRQGTDFQKALETLQIPVSSETSAKVLEDPLMTDILNLLRAIDNPYRDLPLSEYLISQMGGFTLEEISDIRDAAPDTKALFDAMEEKAKENDPLGKKAENTVMWLKKQGKLAVVQPADRFLRLLYLEEALIPYSSSPVLLYLYDRARVYQRSSFCGLFGFLEFFTKAMESGKLSAAGFEKAEDAVTIMTIHHSKGLEFPVVFVVSSASQFNRDDQKETLFYRKNPGFAAKLYSQELSLSEETAPHLAAKLQIIAEESEESIRTLYVALTRARERLYVTGTLGGKMETAEANAAAITKNNRWSILSAGNYLVWIMAALRQDAAKKADFPCTFHHFSLGEVTFDEDISSQENEGSSAKASSPVTKDPVALRYAKIYLKAQEDVGKPLEHLNIPAKAAASKISPDLLDFLLNDEEQETGLEMQIALMQTASPSFEGLLKLSKTPDAATRGTAMHAFFEFCDFERLQKHGIINECEELVKGEFIAPEQAKLLKTDLLEAFLRSDLWKMLHLAKKVYREQKFGIFLPLSLLTKELARKEKFKKQSIFVQGSIDLLLQMPDDALYLIDYKTDRVTEEEARALHLFETRMQKEHGDQLATYARAVRELFGVLPEKVLLYSVPLAKCIEISVKDSEFLK